MDEHPTDFNLTTDNIDLWANCLMKIRSNGRMFSKDQSKERIQFAKKNSEYARNLLIKLAQINSKELTNRLMHRLNELEETDVLCFFTRGVEFKYITIRKSIKNWKSKNSLINKALEAKCTNRAFLVGEMQDERGSLAVANFGMFDLETHKIIAVGRGVKLGTMKYHSGDGDYKKGQFTWNETMTLDIRTRLLDIINYLLKGELEEELKDSFIITYIKWIGIISLIFTIYNLEYIDPIFSETETTTIAYKNIRIL